MSKSSQHQTAQLLRAWTRGDADELKRLMPRVVEQLQKTAASYLFREREDHTPRKQTRWQDRAHFYAIAAEMMRHILVQHASSRRHTKQSDAAKEHPRDQAAAISQDAKIDLLALDNALRDLAVISERQVRVVELRS